MNEKLSTFEVCQVLSDITSYVECCSVVLHCTVHTGNAVTRITEFFTFSVIYQHLVRMNSLYMPKQDEFCKRSVELESRYNKDAYSVTQ